MSGLANNQLLNQRAKKMLDDIVKGYKKQHIIVNSAVDFEDVMDLYINSYSEWLEKPFNSCLYKTRGVENE